MITIIFLLSILVTVYGYPYKLQCSRSMQVGSVIMGGPAKLYDIRSIVVRRNGVQLESGSQFTPGESLLVQISTISSSTGLFKFMFEVSGGALFSSGPTLACDGRRSYELGGGGLGDSTLVMPMTPNTQVNIWAGWATQYGQVFITHNFTLINFPSTQFPTKSPDYKSLEPTVKPSKIPTVKVPTIDSSPKLVGINSATQQDFTLVLQRANLPDHYNKRMITVNGTVPGPTIRVQVGQWVTVKVINELKDDLTLIHWHGFDQKNTPWADGTPGLAQCAINTMVNQTNYYSPISTTTTMTYRFLADRSGTYWYHGHYDLQYPEGLYGAIIVEDDAATTSKYASLGATYTQETEILIADFYESSALDLADAYMTPDSNGYEPVPDFIVVNNMFSQTMQIKVDKSQPLRLRIINSASISMFDISVNGLPLTVIEADGIPLQPKTFGSVRVDAGQRVSIILDWSQLDPSLAGEINIPLKVKAVKSMYKKYDPSDASNFGLLGSTSKSRFFTTWVGQFIFTNANDPLNYYYYGVSITTPSKAPDPVESNLLEMAPLYNMIPPPADLYMDYNITFSVDTDGVRKYFINGQSYHERSVTSPLLYDYMMPQGGPVPEPINLPKYSVIQGDANTPFILPYNRSITITIRNEDGMSHPIHTHGHAFWIMATSLYTPITPIKRDTVTVPATGWVKIRFMSDNPGVWFMHCHIDWHMVSGFMGVMVEAPSKLKNTIQNIPADHKDACAQYFAPTTTPTFAPSNAPMTGTWSPTRAPSKKPITSAPTYKPMVMSTDPFATDWSTYGYDARRTGINPSDTKINTITGKKWKKVWRYQLAGGALMQPVVALNYDFGTSINVNYQQRRLLEWTPGDSFDIGDVISEAGEIKTEEVITTAAATNDETVYWTTSPNSQPTFTPFSTSSAGSGDCLPYESLGCYADSIANRAMTLVQKSVVSVAECYNIASYQGYTYFAVQDGSTCYGSNKYANTIAYGICGSSNCTGDVPMCACDTKCRSGSGVCGGSFANIVYGVVTNTKTPTIAPVIVPTKLPTKYPTKVPTLKPSTKPSFSPSFAPVTTVPSLAPVSGIIYNYIGCYGDKPDNRAFLVSFGYLTSVQACFTAATQANYKYFGIQYGGECWVGNDYNMATQYGVCGSQTSTGAITNCDCNVPCNTLGGSCGGSFSNSVYSIVDNPFTSSPSTKSSATPLVPTVSPSHKPVSSPTHKPVIMPTTKPVFSSKPVKTLMPTSVPTLAPTYSKDFTYVGCYGDYYTRAFSLSYGNQPSVKACYTLAYTNRYKYFGVQYGGECWVSNDYASVTQYGVCGQSTGGIKACTCTMACQNGDKLCGGAFANAVWSVNNPLSVAPTVAPVTAKPIPPTFAPTTAKPTFKPTTASPTITYRPTNKPTKVPTRAPSQAPVVTEIKNNYVDSTIMSVAYIGDEKGVFHAVNANTGMAIWTRKLGYVMNPLCGDIAGQFFGMTGSPTFNRTVNAIYITSNGTFYALSMKTGETLWSLPKLYDPYYLTVYGALNEYNGIVYFPTGSMCDQLEYIAGIYAVSTFTKSVIRFFSPTSANPNIIDYSHYGGGVWGLGGITISKVTNNDQDSPLIYAPIGNALNLPEDALFCESVVSMDLNLKYIAQNKPPKSTIMGDNDYGSSATVFNIPQDGQTSGCKLPLVGAMRKDGLYTVSNAVTMKTIQNIQISASNRPSGIQQAIWEPLLNLLIISNQFGGLGTPHAGKYGNGIVALELNSTCGLKAKWTYSGTSISGITISGLPGQRVAISVNGYGSNVVDIQTGAGIANFNWGGSAQSPPAIANGTLYVGLQDPGLSFVGQAMEAWRPA